MASATSAGRLMSLDALRGFDMFWIMGAEGLVHGLRRVSDAALVHAAADQLEHVAWAGFHFYDLIFPLFVFLMGVSAVFSLEKLAERSGRRAAYQRLFVRSLTLYLLGLFYYGGQHVEGGPEMFRYVGVLQRIAICNLCAGLIVLNARWRGVLLWCASLLLIYWGLLALVPFPGAGVDRYAEGHNLTNYIDQVALPGFKWDGQWDPEGLLSHLPAISTALLGALAGYVLRDGLVSNWKKVGRLLILGTICLVLGWLWSFEFPIIKKIWTSSFVLWAGGWSFLLLALFFATIDVLRWQRWAQPFVWIGTNCIAIYLLGELIDFSKVVQRVLHRELLLKLGNYAELTVAVLALSLAIAVCWQLHRRQLFWSV